MPTDERNDPPAGKRWPVTSAESQVYIDTGELPDARVREASTFEVFERPSNTSHGVYDTLDEARGCVEFDELGDYEIWQGDHIVEEAPPREE